VQPSDLPTADEVRRAVATTLRRWQSTGCAVQVAAEFRDHPETAVTRMSWALATGRTVYSGRSRTELTAWSSTHRADLRKLPAPTYA
jgi:hypothetical protein